MTSLIKLNVGSGPFKKEGFTNVDLLPGPNIDIVASADRLPFEDNSIGEILAEHLIEHLTNFQFNRTMAEWYRVLEPKGRLTIECPDLLGLCKQFVEANEYRRYQTSGDYWPIINQIYGHQLGSTEEIQLSQVHKNGFTEDRLKYILEGVGYEDIFRIPHERGPSHASILRMTCIKK